MNLFWLLVVLLALGSVQSFIFSRFNFKGLKYTRSFSKHSVYEGESVEMVEQIVNRKILPVPWLRVESRISPNLRFQTAQEEREISEDEQYHKSVFYLGPYSRVTRRHAIKCLKRGDYQLSTVEAAAGDLVNFGHATRQMDVSAHLLVYPKLLSDEQLDMPSRKWQGDVMVKRWIMPDPFLVGGLREYREGDPMRAVHWGASARTGRLQVKTYDYTADPRLMVVLNVQMQEHQWGELMKYEQDTIEYGISLAATLLTRALESGVEAGFACNGQLTIRPEEPVVIPPQRASTQGDTLLGAMAQLEIKRALNFHTFLEELSAFQDMDILILSAYDSELIQQGVELLRMRGNSVTLNLIGAGAMKKLFDNALLCLWRALLFSPIILIAGGLLPGASQLSAGLYYAAGQLLALAMSFVPARGRVAVMILAGAAYAAAGVFALGALEAPFVFIIVALSLTMYALSVHAEGAGEYDPRLMIAGAIIHAGAPLVIKLSGEQMNYTAMMWAGIVFLMMCPYVMNNTSVRSGMSLRGRGGRPIKRISRANRVMVTVMLAVALMIAGAEAIRAAAQRAGSFVMYWVGQFIWWLMSLMPGESGGGGMGGGAPDDLGLGMETAEPSWFAQLLEQIMRYFVVAVLIAGAAFVLWKLGKVLIRLMRKLSEWAKQFAQGVKEDYLEEREQLMDWGEVRGEIMESVKEALRKFTTREKKWGELDARERVRYVMRQLYRKRGVAVSGLEYMSARQALAEMDMDDSVRAGLGELYDRARYSDHEVTEAQAEEARRVTK